jgi:hypothetical protein
MAVLQAQAKMDINTSASYYQQPHTYPPPAAISSDAYAAIVARLKAAGIPPGSGGEMVAAAAAMAAAGGPAALSQLMAAQGSMQDTTAASALIEAQARLQSQAAAAAVAHLATSGSYSHGHPHAHGHGGYGPPPPTLLQGSFQLASTAAAGLQHMPACMDPSAAQAMEKLVGGASAMQHFYMPPPYGSPTSQPLAAATLSAGQQYVSSQMQYGSGMQYSGGTFPSGIGGSKGMPEMAARAMSSGGPMLSAHQQQGPDRPSLKRPSTSQEVQPGRKKLTL